MLVEKSSDVRTPMPSWGLAMTVSDLITRLSSYPANARVTLLDPERRWLLPIEIKLLSANRSSCGVDFIAITSANDSDEIEGLALQLPRAEAA
jgi:hypothetical protein